MPTNLDMPADDVRFDQSRCRIQTALTGSGNDEWGRVVHRNVHGDGSRTNLDPLKCLVMPHTPAGRWYRWLTIISLGALIAPVAWILANHPHARPTGDAFYFHWQATFIANGAGWFISPSSYLLHHTALQSAEHPPGWVLVLAFANTIGIKSFLSQRLLTCVVGGAAVFVTGLAAREVAGPRVGLIAATIAAVYPNYWMNDITGLSETMLILLVAAVVFASYRFWRQPNLFRAAVLGALCTLAALTRSEQALLIVVVLIPLALLVRGVPLRRRVTFAGVGTLTAVLLIAPWVGFNLARFNQPVFMSDDLGGTLAFANCRPAFYGHTVGFGDFKCLYAAQVGSSGDESQGDAHLRRVALHYINAHSSRLPVVAAARVGREFGLYLPLAQIRLDVQLSSRPLVPAWIGLGMYYCLVIGSIYGLVVLRRRRDTLVPFVGLLVEVVVAAMVTFGATRYRAPLEVGLVVLGAVAIDALWMRTAREEVGVRTA